MRDLLDTMECWSAEKIGFGRAVVVRVSGGAPFTEGATLLVTDDGRLGGGVSGGCVEAEVAEAIVAARATEERRVLRLGIADEAAWSAGLACGGVIDVLVEPDVPAEVEAAATGPGGVAVATLLPAPGTGQATPGARVVVGPEGVRAGTLGDASLDAALVEAVPGLLARGASATVTLGGREVFVEAFAAPPRLVIVGAGPVAVHLVALAHELGFRTVVVDARGAFATRERFPLADEVIVGWPDEVADRAGIDADAHVAVLTHDPKVDDPAIALALRRGARYVGAIGSRNTQRGRRGRLREAGLSDEELARLRGPIGLDLGGRTPVEIALAVLAEIVALRRGGTGTPLTEHRGTAAGDSG
ncbi:MAG: XdhC/CoxI family protein [Chloroflexi bacterium]|nr:XdhC/CoxI family protein [Chloroflexota bacterium]